MCSKILNRILSLVCVCALLIPMSAFALEADKTALRQAVEEAVGDLAPYTAESAAAYSAALDAADRVLADENADQQTVDGALADLLAAADGLVPAPALIPGDVDGDRSITSTDARIMLQVAVGKLERAWLPIPDAADPDGDGKTTSTDARLALSFAVGKTDLGHHLVTEPGTPATCTEEGVSDAIFCTDCDLVVSAHKPVPAGHKAVTDRGKAATCTEDGLTDGKHCSVCGEVLTEQQPIPATGHTDTPVCAGCGRDNRKILLEQLKAETAAANPGTDLEGVLVLATYSGDTGAVVTFLTLNQLDGRLECANYFTDLSGENTVTLFFLLNDGADDLFDYACRAVLDDGTDMMIYGEQISAAIVTNDFQYVGYTDSDAPTQEELEDIYNAALVCLDRGLKDLGQFLQNTFGVTLHTLGFVKYNG